jgi:hypothetical protein
VRPLREDRAVILSAGDAGLVRQALVAVAGIFGLAGQAGGPALRLLRDVSLEVTADGRPLDQVHRDVQLAIGCIDSAPPAGGTR